MDDRVRVTSGEGLGTGVGIRSTDTLKHSVTCDGGVSLEQRRVYLAYTSHTIERAWAEGAWREREVRNVLQVFVHAYQIVGVRGVRIWRRGRRGEARGTVRQRKRRQMRPLWWQRRTRGRLEH